METNQEVIRFDLTEEYSIETALEVGALYRKNGGWKFNAIGEGTRDTGLNDMKKNLERKAYGV